MIKLPVGFDWWGSRSVPGLLPGNTITSFLQPVDDDATTLELDLLYKKNQVLGYHNPIFPTKYVLIPTKYFKLLLNKAIYLSKKV